MHRDLKKEAKLSETHCPGNHKHRLSTGVPPESCDIEGSPSPVMAGKLLETVSGSCAPCLWLHADTGIKPSDDLVITAHGVFIIQGAKLQDIDACLHLIL